MAVEKETVLCWWGEEGVVEFDSREWGVENRIKYLWRAGGGRSDSCVVLN